LQVFSFVLEGCVSALGTGFKADVLQDRGLAALFFLPAVIFPLSLRQIGHKDQLKWIQSN